ncbi:MAG: haloacid dehalogenase [Armatimonadota bacterium]|nr:MAG: haloacid dehalogenase [Armatimonadota bacterium]
MSLTDWLARLLVPDRTVERISELEPHHLHEAGIRGLILDLDNTLCEWQSESIPEDILLWVAKMKRAGIRMCIASNTRDRRRLRRMAAGLELPSVSGAPKPGRRCFATAMAILDLKPEEAAVVGDQLFTDILGGRRSGIHTILVRPMHRREFIGTKVSRLFERFLMGHFRRRGRLP